MTEPQRKAVIKAFRECFGTLGEYYTEEAWHLRLGIFMLGWQAATSSSESSSSPSGYGGVPPPPAEQPLKAVPTEPEHEPEELRYKLEVRDDGRPMFRLPAKPNDYGKVWHGISPDDRVWHGHGGFTLVGFAEYPGMPPESDTPITWERVKGPDGKTVMEFKLCAEIVFRKLPS